MTRKINLQTFNFFVTFTYNSELHTEESFRKKLKNCLSHFCTRKGWKYVGVWERSPEIERGCTFTASFISPTARCRE